MSCTRCGGTGIEPVLPTGADLRYARTSAELTQRQLGRLLSMNNGSISRIERGHEPTSLATARRWLAVCQERTS